MSAYVVEPEVIDKIVSRLMNDREDDWSRRRFIEIVGGAPDTLGQTLGQDLLALNVSAVNQRYRENDATPVYTFTNIVDVSLPVALKALRCLQYQCSEGDVPETPLFRMTETLALHWALELCKRIPEYNAAAW